MPLLHMETDMVRGVGNQLQQASGSLQQQTQQLNSSVQALASAWQGNSATFFVGEIQLLMNQFNQFSSAGELLNQRLQREVDEWEQVAAVFNGGSGTSISYSNGNVADTAKDTVSNEQYRSQYDVDEYDFRLNADALIDFQPDYAGKELGNIMKDLNAFIAQNYSNGMCADNPELIQKMADALGLDYQEAQHQYKQLVTVMADSKQDSIENLSLTIDLKNYWGSRRQMLFGKVVGDSMGLHPAFASLLSPSGGLIGPGDGLATLGFDGNLSGIIDENDWDYHGATHDAAGYLYNNYGVGNGYEYVDDGVLSLLNNDGLPTSHSFSGQASGYLFWAQKLGVSYKDFLDVLIKATVSPVGSIVL